MIAEKTIHQNQLEIQVRPGLMVHAQGEGGMAGSPGVHIGTVDHLDGQFIKLKRKDFSDGQHRYIPVDWIESVDQRTVYLNKPEEEVIRQMLRDKNDLH